MIFWALAQKRKWQEEAEARGEARGLARVEARARAQAKQQMDAWLELLAQKGIAIDDLPPLPDIEGKTE